MANVDRAHGFKPIYAKYGEHGRTAEYTLAAANSKIAPGDMLARTADGVVDIAAATSVQLVGVSAEGVAANHGGTILVYDNPGQVYEAQTDNGIGTLTAQTGINLNADFVATGSTGDISLMEIDETSGNVLATLPLVVLGLYKAPDNEFGEFNRLEVMINNQVFASLGTTGI